MSYWLAYVLVLLDIVIFKTFFPPFSIWCIGYILIILGLLKKDPMDPRFWLFLGVNILLVNGFSGVLYVPAYIKIEKIIIYVLLTVISFHLGFGKLPLKDSKSISKFRMVFCAYSNLSNRVHILLGIVGILGAILICFEMFIIFGVSLDDGGERRSQFQNLFPFLTLTPIGVILLGGSFPSIFSIFGGGSKVNVILGLLNVIALALSSMAIAGKQGILFVLLILVYIYLFHKYYRVTIKVSWFVKFVILGCFYFFILYLSFLTLGRHNVKYDGQLLNTDAFSKEFVDVSREYLPPVVQNNFAEFFGYYGNQLPYVAERWDIENFELKYGYFRFPRLLAPFTFLERQIIKIFPFYQDIYPDDRVATIKKQTKGYFGNANWGTIAFLNIKYFGIIGGLIIFFFVGKVSKYLYNFFFKYPNYITFQLNYINCAGMFYFAMFYFTQETGPFFYLLILLGITYCSRKKRLSLYK
ncbi:hypothetical protein B5F24_15500 [Bacteroides clarus]|jgi:hypothetical protein|uniref:Oligosaccharide repeat unit polymerase n=2 Tax=Bacteroides TaxID=816 RepID=A0A1Y3YWJ9_9BACE|nr:MAG: hypothetical protein BHV73_14250 [Bacteroides sp. 44_46]OUO01732.1 hypothetical protein B5F97_05760 [Bacteroides clarus]OUP32105.1 hypothetical protein B5F24_15500 [Bacteroides clarus]